MKIDTMGVGSVQAISKVISMPMVPKQPEVDEDTPIETREPSDRASVTGHPSQYPWWLHRQKKKLKKQLLDQQDPLSGVSVRVFDAEVTVESAQKEIDLEKRWKSNPLDFSTTPTAMAAHRSIDEPTHPHEIR